MHCKSLGLIMVSLGIGVVITLIFPNWMLVFLLGLLLVAIGLTICR